MSDEWEETRARLERFVAHLEARSMTAQQDVDVADIRAALQRVQELERALQETRKNWGKTSHYLRTVLAEIVSLRGRVEELERDRDSLRQDRDAFSENLGRAQERVADLEREVRIAVAGESHWERAEAAEAKLARCVEALEKIHAMSKSASDVLILGMGSTAASALAAAKGEPVKTDYEKFRDASPENAALLDAEARVLAVEEKLARCVEAGNYLQHEARLVAIPGRGHLIDAIEMWTSAALAATKGE